MDKKLIARWETRRGKHWRELYAYADGSYMYKGESCGGNMARFDSHALAIQAFELGNLRWARMDYPKMARVELSA